MKLRVPVSRRAGKQVARLELDGKVVAKAAGAETRAGGSALEGVPDDGTLGQGRFRVASESLPDTFYEVATKRRSCTCPARKVCKHVLLLTNPQ